MATYEEALQGLGEKLQMELTADTHNTCLIGFEDGIHLYLEPASYPDYMMIVIRMGHIPPGRGRELLFKTLLHDNARIALNQGRFGYSRHTDELVLFENIFLPNLTSDELLEIFNFLVEKARFWLDAIKTGRMPTPTPGPKKETP